MTLRKILLPLGVVVCATALASTGRAQRAPQFRSGVDLVQVDVSVIDRERQPVRGLTAADFTVLENGKPQPVAAFDAIDVPDPVEPPTPWVRDVPADVERNDLLQERRLIILVLDDAMIPADQRMTTRTKEIGRSIAAQMGPNDLVAVVFTRDNRNSQNFTNAPARVVAAVDRFTPGFTFSDRGSLASLLPSNSPIPPSNRNPPSPGVNTDGYYFQSSVRVLREITDYLIDIPQRRKALIYVSVGVPFDPEKLEPKLIGHGTTGLAEQHLHQDLLEGMRETFRRAQRANVNIHAIDPAGQNGFEDYLFNAMVQRGFDGGNAMIAARRQGSLTMDFLQTAAENTGGHALVNGADTPQGIAQIFRENSSYYLLGYRSPNPEPDGKFRRIDVRVNKPGVEIRARSGYYARSADAAAATAPPVATALAGLLPKTDVPLSVAATPFLIPGTKNTMVAVVAGLGTRVATSAADEQLELVVSAYSNDGKRQAGETLNVRLAGRSSFELLSRLELKPGRYQLRLAAHLAGQDLTGSVHADVEVPDFTAAPLSLSGIVLNAGMVTRASPEDRFRGVIPIVPTTLREFRTADQVTAFATVYQGSKGATAPVRLVIRITDTSGRVVHEETRALAIADFARGNAADVSINLPIASLLAGDYLLTLDAKKGETSSRRDVRFARR